MTMTELIERACGAYRSGWLVTRAKPSATVARLSTLDEARREAARLSALPWRRRDDILIINPKQRRVVVTFRGGVEVFA